MLSSAFTLFLQLVFSAEKLEPSRGSKMDTLHYKARPNRNAVDIDAVLTRANGGTQGVSVDDLSLDGCRVSGNYRIGDEVKLKLPRIGELRAQVRWSLLGRAGLRFIRSAGR